MPGSLEAWMLGGRNGMKVRVWEAEKVGSSEGYKAKKLMLKPINHLSNIMSPFGKIGIIK